MLAGTTAPAIVSAFAALLGCHAEPALPEPRGELADAQLQELRCAAENRSTAPSYLWLDVSDLETGTRWSTTIESLELAELRELAPDSNPFDIIVPRGQRADRFHPRYDAQTLDAARRHVEAFSDREILEQLTHTSTGGPIRQFATEGEGDRRRAALAHALFERGFFPSRRDLSPEIYVSPTPCEERELTREWLRDDRLAH